MTVWKFYIFPLLTLEKNLKSIFLTSWEACTPRKIGGGGGVRPTSQNPYPIYEENLRYSLPYLWPDQKFETQFMTQPSHENPVSDLHYN